MNAPERIPVWVCDECGYWRKEQSSGVHQTTNPADWRGPMVTHSLREVDYIIAVPVSPAATEEDR